MTRERREKVIGWLLAFRGATADEAEIAAEAAEEIRFLEEQLDSLLQKVEDQGRLLCDAAAVVAEYGGDLDDLRMIVRKGGENGDAMVRAVERTRAKVWP